MRLQGTGMNVFETILARRSVRSYRPREVDHATIQTLLEAAVRAPTAVHEEPWAFAIVQDRELLRHLSDLAKPVFVAEARRAGLAETGTIIEHYTSPTYNIFYNAGTLIVICARPLGPYVAADCWLAAENLMLTACALGLGSCVVGAALPALERPEIKTELDIPAGYVPVAPLIVGYAQGETAYSPRKEPLGLAWKQETTPRSL